jgi:hypothetical protein
MGGNSIEYLTKRLQQGGHLDLLAAVERCELSTYAAAEAAGIVKRRPVTGGGSENQARRRNWAVLRATGKAPALEPRPEPKPTPPKFSPATRDVIAKLVEDGRTDLVLAVMERRISPSAASRLAAGTRRRPAVEDRKPAAQTEREEKKPEKAFVVDVKALIA